MGFGGELLGIDDAEDLDVVLKEIPSYCDDFPGRFNPCLRMR